MLPAKQLEVCGYCLLDSLYDGLCGLHDRLRDLLNGLLHRCGRLLDSLDHGGCGFLDSLHHGSGSFLDSLHHGGRGFLHRLDHRSGSFLDRFRRLLHRFRGLGHAFDLFFHILSGCGVINLECCHVLLHGAHLRRERGRWGNSVFYIYSGADQMIGHK